jgi:hypothetical protein
MYLKLAVKWSSPLLLQDLAELARTGVIADMVSTMLFQRALSFRHPATRVNQMRNSMTSGTVCINASCWGDALLRGHEMR